MLTEKDYINLWSYRWTIARGWLWCLERRCVKLTANEWLIIFKKDEPKVHFELADKMPQCSPWSGQRVFSGSN